MLVTMKPSRSIGRFLSRVLHSTGLRLLGFAWMMGASLLLIIGVGLAMLGVGGHLLVRARPDSGNVINYDPSTVASFAPVPFLLGLGLMVCFLIRAHKLRR